MPKDLTLNRNTEDTLFDSQPDFNKFFKNFSDVIARYDLNYRCLYINSAIEKMTGINRTNFIGKTNEELNLPPSFCKPWNRKLSKVIKTGKEVEFSFSYSTTEGEKFYQAHLIPEFNEIGEIISVMTISHDISEIKNLERKKDELMSMASHELKTPITSAKMFVQILRRLFSQNKDKKAIHYLRHVEDQINRINKLVNNLLDTSRIETNRLKLNKKIFSIKKLINEVAGNIQATADTHRIIIKDFENINVLADKDRIEQVLVNLIVNAIKYSPQANKIIISLVAKEGKIVVGVEDFGVGIPKKYHQKIFDRFYSISQKKKGNSGLGVGLYISSEIIKQHGGKIYVKSKNDQGSIFYFTLPISI